MTLSILVLESGKGDDAPRLWNATEVGPNAAVDLRYNDETETFFVVEPNVALRKLDPESWNRAIHWSERLRNSKVEMPLPGQMVARVSFGGSDTNTLPGSTMS